MGPRTPPRPVDVTEHFPELREHAATATRLHPRRGDRQPTDSSVGGPLLWPVDETWPVCTDGRGHGDTPLRTPATVRRSRAIYAAARARQATSGRYTLTDEERAELPAYDFSEPAALRDRPIPLVPVAQLYRRDVPDLPGPEDADLLQVLWCPLDHPDEGYNPRVQLRWRRSADVVEPLAEVPEPPVVHDVYLPSACVVHPEQVVEYPYVDLLPPDLAGRIRAWEERSGTSYVDDLSLAPGWKVGGYAQWSLTDPLPMSCSVCGADLLLLFTAGSEGEPADSWRPDDAADAAVAGGPQVMIGRSYSLYVFRCPASDDHPPATAMQ